MGQGGNPVPRQRRAALQRPATSRKSIAANVTHSLPPLLPLRPAGCASAAPSLTVRHPPGTFPFGDGLGHVGSAFQPVFRGRATGQPRPPPPPLAVADCRESTGSCHRLVMVRPVGTQPGASAPPPLPRHVQRRGRRKQARRSRARRRGSRSLPSKRGRHGAAPPPHHSIRGAYAVASGKCTHPGPFEVRAIHRCFLFLLFLLQDALPPEAGRSSP